MTQLLQRYLGGGDTLARLQDHAARLRRLQGAFERCLPPLLAASCKVANLKDDTLVVFAQGNAVAVKLKQMAPSLVQRLAEQGHALREIRVRVALREAAPWRPAPPTRSIPEAGKRSLNELAASLPADSPLREALERLARRSR
ncbi:DUF721 domain-containing protein [Pseudothauera nasutitermitis]|uniref:DUF721 domain-containing protein n=1 Tax=Pseudothauera nasutitermitis TaxID=2565930 RepID=A0A4S4ARC5_9RHOO|nr:DUF721 domain-containing protein [Pseudothauera nasutitermitis]THF61889.1 DUF721 domain-containing protein [Pseudothauera nasutitermitis]